MPTFLLDPDTVRIGDWRPPFERRGTYAAMKFRGHGTGCLTQVGAPVFSVLAVLGLVLIGSVWPTISPSGADKSNFAQIDQIQ